MNLSFVSKYKSVDEFNPIKIGDLSVFTGKNGSGKTHLLGAIKNGNIKVDDISQDEIIYLNYLDFAKNYQNYNDPSIARNVWNRVSNVNNSSDILFQLKQHENQLNEHKKFVEDLAQKVNKAIFELTEEDILNNGGFTEIYSCLENYKKVIYSVTKQQNYVNDDLAQSLYDSVICKSQTFLSSIPQDVFLNLFQKTTFGGKGILSDLSEIFFSYRRNYDRNILKKAKGEAFLDDTEFIKKYGEPPWNLIRLIFSGLNIKFDINDPIIEKTDSYEGTFGIKFFNTGRNNKEVLFNDLSSGEQILITLVNAVYTAQRKNNMPKLLLLDEIDGPLNPSILEKFIAYIKNNFVDKGMKVILASHSPSTIAFAPENSIYIIDTSTSDPIKSTSTNEAIKVLSEGFVTLKDILNLSYIKEDKILISEGKNSKYIKEAMKHLPEDNGVFLFVSNSLGCGELRSLFEFIRRINKDKQFIFVWDNDYRFNSDGNSREPELRSSSTKNNRAFIFKNNDDGIVSDGIENLFSKSLFDDYTKDGGILSDGKLTNKDHFFTFIKKRDNANDYSNFSSLIEFISSQEKTNF